MASEIKFPFQQHVPIHLGPINHYEIWPCAYQGIEMLVFQKILHSYLMDDPYH